MIETQRCDSELGTWVQHGWHPPPGDVLAGFVERIWDFDGILRLGREQTFPDGKLALVVQLDECHRAAGSTESFPPVCLDGLQTRTTTIEAPRGRCRVLGIVLGPLGASALLGSSLRELTDRSTDLHAIVGRDSEELAQTLDAARDGAERVRRARAWTRARLVRALAPEPLIARVFELIERGAGNVAISRLDEYTGRSRSRLAAGFADAIGLAPKRYARIVRFRRALELVNRGAGSLGDVAIRSGYYDQAHMNAEFREHAGLTPREYLTARRYPGSSHIVAP
jgi:AraC-like DNA-binding protein